MRQYYLSRQAVITTTDTITVGITPITHITKVMTRNPNYQFGNGVDLLPNIEKSKALLSSRTVGLLMSYRKIKKTEKAIRDSNPYPIATLSFRGF